MSDLILSVKTKEKRIRSLQQEKARGEGQRAQLMSRLKSEFGISSIEEAVSELEKLQLGVEDVEKDLSKFDKEMGTIISNAERGPISSSCEGSSEGG